MNVGPDHHEPLDAEERALAERLARIGPFDGPSPALDAKILKAAHAAASTRVPSRRRRWAALIGVPPALVTGVGVAAAAVLALGLVWQLRPAPTLLPAMSEESASGDEVFVAVEPASTPRAPIVNPPPFPAEAPASPAASADRGAAPIARAEAKAEAAPPPMEVAAATARDAAAEAAPAAASAFPEVDPRERATADLSSDATKSMESRGFSAPAPAAAPAVAPAPAKRRPTYTNSARATATRRQDDSYQAPPAAQAAQPANEAEAAQELDSIVVTGSRIATPGNLAREDARLEPVEWLERIRARRDAGEVEAARESLQLFRKEHPRARIPDDLRALLVTDPDQ